ncbi:MAG: Hpt domain-containing protein [Hyphomonadaceae bacterium]
MSKPRVEIIDPRDVGLRTLDMKTPVFDGEALARADKTLEALGGSMEQWLDADIERLQIARQLAAQTHWSAPSVEALAAAAHDLKGVGATYGYPLAGQLAASLCRLIESPAGKADAAKNAGLIGAHVDALRAVVRDRIKTDGHATSRALLRALEMEVARLDVAPR